MKRRSSALLIQGAAKKLPPLPVFTCSASAGQCLLIVVVVVVVVLLLLLLLGMTKFKK